MAALKNPLKNAAAELVSTVVLVELGPVGPTILWLVLVGPTLPEAPVGPEGPVGDVGPVGLVGP